MTHCYKIFLYVALSCEAKPLIEHYKLKKDLNCQPFTVYGRDYLCLVVTGLGKTAMAAAMAYTQALFSADCPVLINIGVAGHRDYALGELYLAHKIIDSDTEKSFFPALVIKTKFASAVVCTASKPQLDYNHEALCDMEASAFYETACRFSYSELVQCVKVVSDNQQHPANRLEARKVSELIEIHIPSLTTLMQQTVALTELLKVPETPLFSELTMRYHFSVSARIQLKNLLSRWTVLRDGQPLEMDIAHFKNSKAVLDWLNQQLEAIWQHD